MRRQDHVRGALPNLKFAFERARRSAEVWICDHIEHDLWRSRNPPGQGPERSYSTAYPDIECERATREKSIDPAATGNYESGDEVWAQVFHDARPRSVVM
jgi:hypothetical protein